jgi:hypothetical protein
MRIVKLLSSLLAWRNWQTRTAQDRMGQPVEVRVLSRADLASIGWCLVSRLFSEKARINQQSQRPVPKSTHYLPLFFLLAAHRAFINWESRFRPAGVIPPFFAAGVPFVWPLIFAQRALAAAASLARVAAGIGRRTPLLVAARAREPARIEERRFCNVSICRRIETASCKASTDISMSSPIAGVGGNGN